MTSFVDTRFVDTSDETRSKVVANKKMFEKREKNGVSNSSAEPRT